MMNWKKILGFKWYASFAVLAAGCCIYTTLIGWSYWQSQPEKWDPEGQQKTGSSGTHRTGHYYHGSRYYHK